MSLIYQLRRFVVKKKLTEEKKWFQSDSVGSSRQKQGFLTDGVGEYRIEAT